MLLLAMLMLQPAALSPLPAPKVVARADPMARYVRAEGQVAAPGVGTRVRLLISGDDAALQVSANGKEEWLRPLLGVDEVLTVLADTRLSFLWPALLEWAGSDLAGLRDRQLEERRLGAMTGTSRESFIAAERLSRNRTRALMQYATTLARSGRRAEAIALLRAQLRPVRKSGSRRAFETMMIGLRAVGIYRTDAAYGSALALLDELQRMELGKDFQLNLDVNRASLLAQSGRYAEALTLIDNALAQFSALNIDDENYAIGGSGRHFAWIRACALKGLGRNDEARSAMAAVATRGEVVQDEYVPVELTDSIRFRGQVCMRDADGIISDLLAELEGDHSLGSTAFLLAQPAARERSAWRSLLSTVFEDPRIKAALAGRARMLPPEFDAALRAWRPSPAKPDRSNETLEARAQAADQQLASVR